MTRLAPFILANIEPILSEWEAFARTIWPGQAGADVVTLRDHAEAILRATAHDMEKEQSATEQNEKSQGNGRENAESEKLDDASTEHGMGRAGSGFSLPALVAEYRALRASVIRLWRAGGLNAGWDDDDIDDLTRFNESIDQSLARAVGAYTEHLDHSRQTFLAILGHDLRTPLSAMRMASYAMRQDERFDHGLMDLLTIHETSGKEMSGLIADLLDFARTAMGDTIPIHPEPADLGQICRNVAAEMHSARPGCQVSVHIDGDLTGEWDAARLRQVVANLVGNAIQHGGPACRAEVTAAADGSDAVIVSVHNDGLPIPRSLIPTIFEPLVRDTSEGAMIHHRAGSMGLGLYIARAITTTHGGTIDVASTTDAGTTFTVRLPR